ncbi:MAG: FAD-dependent oxidoreductase [Dehalococcoidia bacterium]|nr:FAD-dependent oxidoreductase [Dehalococcoidia bacterium]
MSVLHYIGAVENGEIARVLGGVGLAGKIPFTELDPDGFDTLVFPDFTFRVPKGWDNYRARLIETFPDEAEGVARTVDTMRAVIEELRRVGVPDADTDLERYLELAPNVVTWAMRPLDELFGESGLGERSRAVITGQAGDYAAPRRAVVSTRASSATTSRRAFYVSGGGQVLAGHLIDVIHSNGGRVRTHAEVTAIETEPGGSNGHRATGVTLADGEQFESSTVIATGDIKRLFAELLNPDVVPAELRETVAGYRMATALATVYLGLDFEITDRMGATNIWIHPRYDSERYYDAVEQGRFDPEPPVYVFAPRPGSADPIRRRAAPRSAMAGSPRPGRLAGRRNPPRYASSRATGRRNGS